ncbi:MAG: restriction endonuclease [Pseudomonadales bacterium]|nr:restriction endonuclease [Pseudomonadales bacterium]
MSEVHQDIVSWLNDQQYWLQKLAKLIINQGSVSDDGISSLCELLKTSDGQSIDTKTDFSEFMGGESTFKQLKLETIGEIHGIDNLSPRTPLEFGSTNLSVVYGNNGSGKSGYTRILKKVCGKANAVELRANVYAEKPQKQQCTIGYNIDGQSVKDEWLVNSDAIDALNSIDIFDSLTGRIYIDKASGANYIPETVALFEDLVSACIRIKSVLESEQASLKKNLPLIKPEYSTTNYAIDIGKLSATTEEEKVREFYKYTKDDESRVKELEERLKGDPAGLSKSKRQRKQGLETLLVNLESAIKKINSEAITNFTQLHLGAVEKRGICKEFIKANTEGTVISGVGSTTWQAMWSAAKQYSIAEAYTGKSFPNTSDSSHCILCHQQLSDAAKQRLNDFEGFVVSTLEQDAKLAEDAYLLAVKELPIVKTVEDIKTSIQAAQIDEDMWLPIFTNTWIEIEKCITSIKESGGDFPRGYTETFEVFKPIRELIEALESEAVQHEKDIIEFDSAAINSELINLKAKEWVSGYLESYIEEIGRLKKVAQYDDWLKLTKTRSISTKAGSVSETVITQAYIDRFNSELDALGAKNIKVELVKKGVSGGKTKHQVQLKGLVAHKVKTDDVLSEGEHRIVSLAAFLADVLGQPSRSPFIFDDPISSLDHDYETEVAKRLVLLSLERQVLVFTHRLSLYGALEECSKSLAKKAGGEGKDFLSQRCIQSFDGTAGHMVEPDTWVAATKTANNILITRLNDAKKSYADLGDIQMFSIVVQSICSDFRKLLERTIEDDLLQKVVNRHRRSITTVDRLDKLHYISPDDCKYFDVLMTKYSCYEHSQSTETPVFIPEYQDLIDDLNGLKLWREKFKARPSLTSA